MINSASGFLKEIYPWLCENWSMWANYLVGNWKCPIAKPLSCPFRQPRASISAAQVLGRHEHGHGYGHQLDTEGPAWNNFHRNVPWDISLSSACG